MVGQVGLEPTMFQKSRIYSPLQSPLCILTHMAEAGGLEPPDGFPRRFSRPVRYQLRSMLPYVVGATGLEPTTSATIKKYRKQLVFGTFSMFLTLKS